MFSIRLVLFLFLLVLIQADANNHNNNYFRGERIIPASSRVTNGGSPNTAPNNGASKPYQVPEVLEFQSVKKVAGSKPAKGASNPHRRRAYAA